MRDHIAALHAAFRDQHDIEDSKGDDRPTPRPNWAMRCTGWLEEIERELDERDIAKGVAE